MPVLRDIADSIGSNRGRKSIRPIYDTRIQTTTLKYLQQLSFPEYPIF